MQVLNMLKILSALLKYFKRNLYLTYLSLIEFLIIRYQQVLPSLYAEHEPGPELLEYLHRVPLACRFVSQVNLL